MCEEKDKTCGCQGECNPEPPITGRDRSPIFNAILDEMRELHDRKNRDYCGRDKPDPFRNFKAAAELGVDPFVGVLVRTGDKWERLKNLVRTGVVHVQDEQIEDNLLDLAVYAVLALAVRRESKVKAVTAKRHIYNPANESFIR